MELNYCFYVDDSVADAYAKFDVKWVVGSNINHICTSVVERTMINRRNGKQKHTSGVLEASMNAVSHYLCNLVSTEANLKRWNFSLFWLRLLYMTAKIRFWKKNLCKCHSLQQIEVLLSFDWHIIRKVNTEIPRFWN